MEIEDISMVAKKITVKDIICLQAIVIIYTLNGILAKLSTGSEVLSIKFILFYGAEIGVLGVYAILWQQIIKKFELSVAYANRAMAIMWSAIWAAVFFGEVVSIKQAFGILLVLAGTIVVNMNVATDNIGGAE